MSKITETQEARRRTVLVVEDSHTQALRLQALLAQEGLEVTLAFDGGAGLQMAHHLRPDAIILDVQMPKLNGYQVCERLKEARETAHIPIIMLTCHDEQEAVMEGLQMGAIDYIPKDAFADAVLLETLRQMGLIEQRVN